MQKAGDLTAEDGKFDSKKRKVRTQETALPLMHRCRTLQQNEALGGDSSGHSLEEAAHGVTEVRPLRGQNSKALSTNLMEGTQKTPPPRLSDAPKN